MSIGTLVAGPLHKIGRRELEQIPVPEATLTHKPVPHHVIVEALVETPQLSPHRVVNEEYAVSFDGVKMFGVLDLETQMEGCRFSIGIRNSHDKPIRRALTSGLARNQIEALGVLRDDGRVRLFEHGVQRRLHASSGGRVAAGASH
jgi:hypothetical protein